MKKLKSTFFKYHTTFNFDYAVFFALSYKYFSEVKIQVKRGSVLVEKNKKVIKVAGL